jgi:uncharacterized protein
VAAYLGWDGYEGTTSTQRPSQHSQNIASEQLTSSLMASIGDIVERGAADGRDVDSELRAAVRRAVLEGVVAGYDMNRHEEEEDGQRHTRRRVDHDQKQ